MFDSFNGFSLFARKISSGEFRRHNIAYATQICFKVQEKGKTRQGWGGGEEWVRSTQQKTTTAKPTTKRLNQYNTGLNSRAAHVRTGILRAFP